MKLNLGFLINVKPSLLEKLMFQVTGHKCDIAKGTARQAYDDRAVAILKESNKIQGRSHDRR